MPSVEEITVFQQLIVNLFYQFPVGGLVLAISWNFLFKDSWKLQWGLVLKMLQQTSECCRWDVRCCRRCNGRWWNVFFPQPVAMQPISTLLSLSSQHQLLFVSSALNELLNIRVVLLLSNRRTAQHTFSAYKRASKWRYSCGGSCVSLACEENKL